MAENDTGRHSSAAGDSRLQSLKQRLEAANRTEAARSPGRSESEKGANQAHRAVGELIGGAVGGAIVGWVLDQFFGTEPWLMIGLVFLGFIVAVRNIYRLTSKRPE